VTSADSTSGDPLDMGRVDANPLMGRCYKFRGLLPLIQDVTHLKTTGGTNVFTDLQMSDTNTDGVLIPNTTPMGNWRGLPTNDVFSNCISSAAVTLNPGEIKNDVLHWQYNGLLSKMMTVYGGLTAGAQIGTITDPYNKSLQGRAGNCMLYVFEKRMKTGTSANITVNYQGNFSSGARAGGVGKQTCQRTFVFPAAPVNVILS